MPTFTAMTSMDPCPVCGCKAEAHHRYEKGGVTFIECRNEGCGREGFPPNRHRPYHGCCYLIRKDGLPLMAPRRLAPKKAVVAETMQVIDLEGERTLVTSEHDANVGYIVDMTTGECECATATYRRWRQCKHVDAASAYFKRRREFREAVANGKRVIHGGLAVGHEFRKRGTVRRIDTPIRPDDVGDTPSDGPIQSLDTSQCALNRSMW